MNTDFIIPAIDIMDGKLVRLTQGDYNRRSAYNTDPLSMARSFEDAGLTRIHLVDLDGARAGAVQQLSVLEKIARNTKLVIDFGGGIKTGNDVRAVLNAGAQIITVGSIAVKQPELLQEWITIFGADKFFVGADVQQEKIKINGWLQDGGIDIYSFIQKMCSIGAQHFFCTDISKDGAMQGPAVTLYKNIIAKFPTISLTASGGVAGMDDIHHLKQAGCTAVIIGKAIYEGKITLEGLRSFNHSPINDSSC